VRAAIDLVALCRAAGATLIVNDDPRVAAASGAHGVHLGQLDGTVAEARKVLPPGSIVGRSTGDLDQLRLAVLELQRASSASAADYVAFGPIWETPHLSRPKPVRGVERLQEARGVVPASVPLVAIGGITAARLPEVRGAGADAWAVIGAIASAEDPVAATRSLL
jgi:thiamine-phosphate pyrophosphorylase